jgi:hypothetical protein
VDREGDERVLVVRCLHVCSINYFEVVCKGLEVFLLYSLGEEPPNP